MKTVKALLPLIAACLVATVDGQTDIALFTGPADLDLAGTLVYAVDIGGPGGTVSGVGFSADDVGGVTVQATNLAAPWG